MTDAAEPSDRGEIGAPLTAVVSIINKKKMDVNSIRILNGLGNE